MRLNVIWFVPPPLALIAEAQGFNEARGVEIAPSVARGSDQQHEAVVTGRADAAVTAMDNVLMWNQRGAVRDFRVIAQMEAATGFILVARPGINSIAELKDCELLVDSAENGFAIVLRAMLHDAGIGPDQYHMTVVGGVRERFEALVDGQGDATLLATFVEKAAVDKGCTTLARVDDVYPGFPGQGLVTRTSELDRNGPALSAWLEAMHDARLWAHQNVDAARNIVANAGFPAAVADRLISTVPRSFRPDEGSVALLLTQRRQLGLPGADGTAELLVDTSLLQSALD